MNGPIDHSNYEAWLLDRLEGRLTPEQERELHAFLLQHPHLAPGDDVLPSVESINLALSAVEKEWLKKRIPPVGAVDAHSVELHLIARLEGDLTTGELAALRIFLEDHPEHQRAERIYALTKLVPQAMAYATKRELKRHFPPQGMPNDLNLDDLLVARLEGELTREQETAVERFLAHDETRQRAWVLMQATRSSATYLVFADKEGLKKKEGRVIPFTFGTWAVRLAAASVALLIGLGLWFLRSPDVHEREIARVPSTNVVPQEQVVQDEVPEHAAPNAPGTSDAEQLKDATPPARNETVTPFAPQRQQPVSPPRIDRVEEPMLAQDAPAPGQKNEPIDAPVIPPTPEANETLASAPTVKTATTASATNTTTLGELLATTVRDRVLEKPARDEQALDGEDAIAMVDRTLKVVGGDRAGLDVGSKAYDGKRRFDLRLGRNFSISASR